MTNIYPKFAYRFYFGLLAMLVICADLDAQLIMERELIGAAAGTSTVINTGSSQQLQIDASFGETMIGYQEGDIVVTVGFHQPSGSLAPANMANRDEPLVRTEEERISVNAYPNPTINTVTVDLGDFQERFAEIRLIDAYGRVLRNRAVGSEQLIKFNQLGRLPNANYYLQGIGNDGRLHQLATIAVVNAE